MGRKQLETVRISQKDIGKILSLDREKMMKMNYKLLESSKDEYLQRIREMVKDPG